MPTTVRPPLTAFLLPQLLGWTLALGAKATGILPAGLAPLLLTQLCAALLGSIGLRNPPWWHLIHLGFAPLLALGLALQLAPHWFLLGFAGLLLIYGTGARAQAPLYLSGQQSVATLQRLLPSRPLHVLDAGCGTATLLKPLAIARPDCLFTGIENAPLPWLIACWRTRQLKNVCIRRADFLTCSWHGFDVVYTFLSPVPMPAVEAKAALELAGDAQLISNSFPLPDSPPDRVLQLDDRRQTRLYCYEGRTLRAGVRPPARPLPRKERK